MEHRVSALDAFELRHLIYHIENAPSCRGELHRLLALETPEGRNAWYEARESIGDRIGFLEDLERAWDVAVAERSGRPPRPADVARFVRYALATASIRELAEEIAPAFLALAIENGALEATRALALARRQDSNEPLDALLPLVPFLDEENRHRVLEIVRAAEGRNRRAAAFLRLVPALPQDLQSLWWTRARDALRGGTDGELLIPAVLSVAWTSRATDSPPFGEVVDATRKIADPELRARVHLALLPLLAAAERRPLAEAAHRAARAVERPANRLTVLVELVPHLQGPVRDAAVTLALEDRARIQIPSPPSNTYATERLVTRRRDLGPHPYSRPDPLVRLASFVPNEGRGEVFRLAAKIPDPSYRTRTVAGIAGLLPARGIEQVIEAAARLDDESRAWTLAILASQVPPHLVSRAIAAGRAISKPLEKVRALHGYLPSLAPGTRKVLQEELLEGIGTLRNTQLAMEATAHLLAVSDGPRRVRILERALSALERSSDRAMWLRSPRFDGLLALVPFLPAHGPLLERAFAIVAGLRDPEHRAQGLAHMAHLLPPSLASAAWELAKKLPERGRFGQSSPRAQAIAALVPILSPELHDELIDSALALTSRRDASHLMTAILPLLPPERRPAVMERAVDALLELDNKSVLEPLRQRLSGDPEDGPMPASSAVVDLATSHRVSDPDRPWHERRIAELEDAFDGDRPRPLATLLVTLPRLPEWLRRGPGRQLIRQCRAQGDTEALTLSLPYLPRSLFEEALAAIRELPASEGAPLLAVLAGRLPEDRRGAVQDRAWEGAAEVSLVHRVALLSDLAAQGYRQPHLAARALDLYLGLDIMWRAQLLETPRRLRGAAAAFPLETQPSWHNALRHFAQESRRELVRRLVELTPTTFALAAGRRSETVREILRTLDDVERWWP